MANQEDAIKRAIAKYGPDSAEARAAYNDYYQKMKAADQRPASRDSFGVK